MTKDEEAYLATLKNWCDYDPRYLTGQPIGMFHCPACGCMVVAGMKHPPCDPELCGHTIALPPDTCPICGRRLCLEKNQAGDVTRLHCTSGHDGDDDHEFVWPL